MFCYICYLQKDLMLIKLTKATIKMKSKTIQFQVITFLNNVICLDKIF